MSTLQVNVMPCNDCLKCCHIQAKRQNGCYGSLEVYRRTKAIYGLAAVVLGFKFESTFWVKMFCSVRNSSLPLSLMSL